MCVVSTAPPFPLGRIPTFERARMLQYSLHWMPIGLHFSIVSPNEGLLFCIFFTITKSEGTCKSVWRDRFQKVKYFPKLIGFASSEKPGNTMENGGMASDMARAGLWIGRRHLWETRVETCASECAGTHMPTIEPKVLPSRSNMEIGRAHV